MKDHHVKTTPLPETTVFNSLGRGTVASPVEFELEVTARCNNACRHCYINLPSGDADAKREEMSLEEIEHLADQAVSLGAVWCQVTGGEPLLREDFPDIYMCLRRKGLLVSLFTNATLMSREYVELFQKHPPRDIEVTVYGVTRETYERVTRTPGSYDRFMAGLNALLDAEVRVRLKAMAMRSNVHELPEIARFCRERTKDYFRFDPWLHLRLDSNQDRNEEIKAERLSPDEFVALERRDEARFKALIDSWDRLILCRTEGDVCGHVFHCGAGRGRFAVGHSGTVRVCSALTHPGCTYSLRQGTLTDAYYDFFPEVLDMRSSEQEFREKCRVCRLINLCLWCPANSYLESGKMDRPVEYFCRVAHARAQAIGAVRGGYDDVPNVASHE